LNFCCAPWCPVGRRIRSAASPAWRHILLNGHYTFRDSGQLIDLDAIVAGLDFG